MKTLEERLAEILGVPVPAEAWLEAPAALMGTREYVGCFSVMNGEELYLDLTLGPAQAVAVFKALIELHGRPLEAELVRLDEDDKW
jgi:hypothetical protein